MRAIQYQVKVPGYDDPMSYKLRRGLTYTLALMTLRTPLSKMPVQQLIDMARMRQHHFQQPAFRIIYGPLESAEGGGDEEAVVDLGDGKKAKVNISSLKKLHL